MKCPHCGQTLDTHTCSSCRSEILPESAYCNRCGAKIGEPAPASAGDDQGIDFSTRILCSDGTCIGVINEKGFCKVCGKPYQAEKPAE
jgi:hypothetical protein